MKTVEYYMKGEPKSYKSFETLAEAQAFMAALCVNPKCEGYGLVR